MKTKRYGLMSEKQTDLLKNAFSRLLFQWIGLAIFVQIYLKGTPLELIVSGLSLLSHF